MECIVIFANGKAAIPSIEFLVNKKYKISVVVDPHDKGEDTWQVSLKKYCIRNSIPFLQPSSFKDSDFLKAVTALSPLCIFSMQCRTLIQKEIIEIVQGEIFNFHFSDLPKNRGCYPGIWHILNDDYCAVTLHKLIEGIDDGPIIEKVQKKITVSDTGKSVYEWCCDQVKPLLEKNLEKLATRSYTTTLQKSAEANYYSRNSLDFSHIFVDWNQDTKKVGRFIQAFIFPPFQYPKTRYKTGEMYITAIIKMKQKKRVTLPGKILSVYDKNIEIEVKNGSVTIQVENADDTIKPGDFFYL